ncbi:MAG: MFS transporter, partial [Alphaproteobacteria bacterium]
IWSNIADGYRYTVAHPAIGPLLLLLIVSSFAARSIVDLLPGFAEDVFARGAAGLAWLTSAMGLGATLAGLWLARRQGLVGLTGVVLAQLVVIAAALIAFVATDIFWVAIPALMLSGFAMIINGVGSQVLIQSTVAGAMRGRVMSLFTLILQGSPAFGTLIIGVVSESIGLRIPVAVAAVLCLAAWLWMLPRAAAVSRAFEGERPG